MPTYRLIPVEDLGIDERYQRDLKQRHPVLTDEWDPALQEVLAVSERASGEWLDAGHYAVFDGQHRLIRARRDDFEKMPCLVHTGLTDQQEADLFASIQDRRRPLTPLDRFRAREFAGDPVAVGMQEAARKQGFSIENGPGNLQAVVAVERCYRRGNLDATLVALNWWRGYAKALEGALIDGVSRFFDLYPDIDMMHAQRKWEGYSPTVILGQAQEYMVTRKSKAYGVVEVVRKHYTDRNHRLPTVQQQERARVQTTRGAIRYTTVTLEQVRDAFIDIFRERGRVYTEDLQERLSVSRASLTRQGTGFIDQLLKQGKIVRKREPVEGRGGGRFFYEYVPLHRQKGPRSRPRKPTPESQNGSASGAAPVAGTGRPAIRSGSMNIKRAAQQSRRVVQRKR